MSWCRFCCNPGDQCVNIFSHPANELDGTKIPLEVKIYDCLKIGAFPGDGMSNLICHTCISFVNSWFAFKTRAELCDVRQRNWIAQMPGMPVAPKCEDSAEESEEEIDVVDQSDSKKRKFDLVEEAPSTSYSSNELMAFQMAQHPDLGNGGPEKMLEVNIGVLKEKSEEPLRPRNKRNRKKPLRLKSAQHRDLDFGSKAHRIQDENKNPNLLYDPKCAECVSIVKKNHELTKHMIIAHGSSGQIIECTYCDHTYLTESSMKNHVFKVHGIRNQDVRQIKCEYCVATVKSLPDMKKHIISEHQDMSHKLLNCTICPEQFINLTGLKAHLYKIHNVYKEDYHTVIPEIMNSLNSNQ